MFINAIFGIDYMYLPRPRLSILLLFQVTLPFHPTKAIEPPLFNNYYPDQNPLITANMTRAAAIALSHGGGPMPLLGDPIHAEVARSLRERVPSILRLDTPNKPRAICVVTAHWSESSPCISSAAKHHLYFDYSNFPPETYKYKYPAPGSPEVAQEVAAAMREEGLNPTLDEQRGWDHGVFVPMMLIRPQADIPIVQVSVLESEDPGQHFAMGRALAKLREQNVAIVGSGFATLHNIRVMLSGALREPDFKKRNDDWSSTVTDASCEVDIKKREEMFKAWRKWPNAYEMHPRGGADHFMPLIVLAGAGEEGKAKLYTDDYKGVDFYSYYWD